MQLPRRLRSFLRKAAIWAGPVSATTALRGCPCPAAVYVPPRDFSGAIAVEGAVLDGTPASWRAFCEARCGGDAACAIEVYTSEGNNNPAFVDCERTRLPETASWVSACKEACGEEQDCSIGPEEADAKPVIRCISWWENCASGRRTAGVASPAPRADGAAGLYLAHLAGLEAQSVPAFERLARELRAHGAPRALRRGAARARRDERRHARAVGALARRHGGTAATPVNAGHAERAVRPLEEVAVENAVEGCVREAYGAAVAAHQARAAGDADVRAVMRGVARDEARHAALAWAVHAWVWPRLGAAGKARVRWAIENALAELAEGLPAEGDSVAEEMGMPRDGRLIEALGEALGLGRGAGVSAGERGVSG